MQKLRTNWRTEDLIFQSKNSRMEEESKHLFISVFTLWKRAAVQGINQQRELFTVIRGVQRAGWVCVCDHGRHRPPGVDWCITLQVSPLHTVVRNIIPCLRLSALFCCQAAEWTRRRRQRQSSSAWWDRRAHGPWEPPSADAAPRTGNPPEDKPTSRDFKEVRIVHRWNKCLLVHLYFINKVHTCAVVILGVILYWRYFTSLFSFLFLCSNSSQAWKKERRREDKEGAKKRREEKEGAKRRREEKEGRKRQNWWMNEWRRSFTFSAAVLVMLA